MRLAPFVVAVLTAACADAPSGPEQPDASSGTPASIKLIALNDYHGNLQSPGTLGANSAVLPAQRPTVGGAEYIAAYVQRLKAQNPLNAVVGAGDFIGASPLISGLFFDEPAVETLNKIGVDFSAVGNHEFDKGAAELLRLQAGGCKRAGSGTDPNSCMGLGSSAPGSFDGARFQWLSANVIDTATGRTLLPAYGIKRLGSVNVAFIGMTLKETPAVVTPTGVAGLSFRDEADTVNALVPELRSLHAADVIVVLVHQGGEQASSGLGDINGCDGELRNADGSDSEIRAIVKRLDDAVDLVISGHTHQAYNCSSSTVDVKMVNGVLSSTARPTGLPNQAGRLVPVTSASAFGRLLTDIDLTIDARTRRVTGVQAVNRLVDRSDPQLTAMVQADPSVKNIVDGYDALSAPLTRQVLGTITAPLPNIADTAGEIPAGSLIADTYLQAAQPAALGGAMLAFTNPGGVRNGGFAFAGASYPYDVTYGDAFTVQPFGNSLVTMTLTAQQIKDLLEQQFPGCLGQARQRILPVSNGVKYSWSASAAPCSRIVDLSVTPTDVGQVPPVATGPQEQLVIGGVVQNPGKTYRVTANFYIANGGDGFTVFTQGTARLGGAQDLDAFVAYMAGYKSPASPYDPAQPALGMPRITRLP